MAAKSQRLPEPEELFADYVQRMARHRDGRECLIVHMSLLSEPNRTRHHLELVQTRLGQFARRNDGRVFPFLNGDMGLVVCGAPTGALDSLMFDIRYGFAEDPLVEAEDAGEAIFIERFDMRWDFDEVEKLARARVRGVLEALENQTSDEALHLDASARPQSDRKVSGTRPSVRVTGVKTVVKNEQVERSEEKPKPPSTFKVVRPPQAPGLLDAWLLNNVIHVGGAELRLDQFVRAVPVYEMARRNKVPAVTTVCVDASRLYESYGLTVGMRMNAKLEQFLLKEAEAELMALIDSLKNPVRDVSLGFRLSIELTPETLLSPSFLLLDRRWQAKGRGAGLFWFDYDQIFEASAQILYLLDFLHERGHFAGVRNVPCGGLGGVETYIGQVDFLGLKWPAGGMGNANEVERADFDRAIENYGGSRVFLQQVDAAEKIRNARELGFYYAESETQASEKLLTS